MYFVYIFADYDFSKAFTLQGIIVRMLILIPVWTIVPEMEQKFSTQTISLKTYQRLAKCIITFASVSTSDECSIYHEVVLLLSQHY